ncbi:hypothetical protein [Saccharopolyspora sp. 5N708]
MRDRVANGIDEGRPCSGADVAEVTGLLAELLVQERPNPAANAVRNGR